MGYTRTSGRLHELIPVPLNKKIADITHADTNKHTLDLSAAGVLQTGGETRKIVALVLTGKRMVGTGYLYYYPNEGNYSLTSIDVGSGAFVFIKDGTQRLQYSLTVSGDDYDLICHGYYVEA